MIFLLPGGLIASQELKQALAAHGIACGFNNEGAAPARADEGIDLADQVLGENYVCAYCTHIKSVTYEWDLVKQECPAQTAGGGVVFTSCSSSFPMFLAIVFSTV